MSMETGVLKLCFRNDPGFLPRRTWDILEEEPGFLQLNLGILEAEDILDQVANRNKPCQVFSPATASVRRIYHLEFFFDRFVSGYRSVVAPTHAGLTRVSRTSRRRGLSNG